MDEFDDYLERMIENEILEDEFERDFCNSIRNVEEVPNREGQYNYEDLLFDEGAMFERVMEERGGNLELRMKNEELRIKRNSEFGIQNSGEGRRMKNDEL